MKSGCPWGCCLVRAVVDPHTYNQEQLIIMGAVVVWGLAGSFLLVAVVLLTLVQKSRGDLRNNLEEVTTLRENYDEISSKL